MSRSPIPDEQLRKVQPIVDDLLSRMDALLERLPGTTESALIYCLEAGERR